LLSALRWNVEAALVLTKGVLFHNPKPLHVYFIKQRVICAIQSLWALVM
jgi:hypothetical protein